MMQTNNKKTIEECKSLLIQINEILNKRIKESFENRNIDDDIDRKTMRIIRDENISTLVKIQKMELQEVI